MSRWGPSLLPGEEPISGWDLPPLRERSRCPAGILLLSGRGAEVASALGPGSFRKRGRLKRTRRLPRRRGGPDCAPRGPDLAPLECRRHGTVSPALGKNFAAKCKIPGPVGVYISRGSRKSARVVASTPPPGTPRRRRSRTSCRKHACWPGVRPFESGSPGAGLPAPPLRILPRSASSHRWRAARTPTVTARIRDACRVRRSCTAARS
jgi:hypothetical protein